MKNGSTASEDRLAQRLAQLRDEFDSSFARPWGGGERQANSLLCFTADGFRFAMALPELQVLSKAGPIVPVPSRSHGLLGLTVLRAQVLPVYSIGRLTHSSGAAGACRWLAVLRGPSPVALSLASLEGYAGDPQGERTPVEAGWRFVSGMVKQNESLYAVVDSGALYAAITQPRAGAEKGQDG